MANKLQKTASVTKDGLTLRQEKFCQLYTSMDREMFGNGVQSYIEAFDVDIDKKGAYQVAMVMASKELRKAKIIERINSLLDTQGFNDVNVDKQHLFLLNQHADLKTKLGAIKEYNVLKKRIDSKMELILPTPLLDVLHNPSDKKDSGAK